MKFKLSLTIDEQAKHKSAIVNSISERIDNYFGNRDYGEGIKEIMIGISIVNPPKGFEHLFKEFPPKIIKNKNVTNIHTGEKQLIEKQLHFSFRIDGEKFQSFLNGSDLDCGELVVSEIRQQFIKADSILEKTKHFDRDQFKDDLNLLLEQLF